MALISPGLKAPFPGNKPPPMPSLTNRDTRELLLSVQQGHITVDDALQRLTTEELSSGKTDSPGIHATDDIQVVETHLDDMNPELLGFLMERLLNEGALDVAFSPLQMKKNRPGVRLTVIAPPHLLQNLSRLILLESTAIGVRYYSAQRYKLDRTLEVRETSLGPVQVKVLREGEQVVRVAPEFEECRRLALETGLPLLEIYRIVAREGGVP